MVGLGEKIRPLKTPGLTWRLHVGLGRQKDRTEMRLPFKTDDILAYATLSEIDCIRSPEIAACVLSQVDKEKDIRHETIWAVPLNGDTPWQMTTGSTKENTPRWSPDGSKLAFLSDRKGSLQIYILNLAGGEAMPLGSLPGGVMSIEWSPDSSQLLASCNLTVDPNLHGDRSNAEVKYSNQNPKVAWRLPYKQDGSGYSLASETHLFVIDVRTSNHMQLTSGSFKVGSAYFSPDGKQIAFTRTREGRRANRTDVWIIDSNGKHARRITQSIANTQYPKWSPDGRKLVITGSEQEGDAVSRLWLYDIANHELQVLGQEEVEVVSGKTVHWTDDSLSLHFVMAFRGRQIISSIQINGGSVNQLVTGDRQVDLLALSREKLVFISECARSPNEIHCANLAGGEEVKLTNFNAWWSEKFLPKVEIKSFNVPNGEGEQETIEGWLLTPSSQPGPFPLLVDVHGGPASYAFVKYNWHSYWQILVSRGWAILALNPVGSSSYGVEFNKRLRGKWGELDFDQHLAAIAQLQLEGIADERLAICGKSYGGYMSAWAIGHTDKFKAAVVSAPVTNLETHYSTSDSGYYSDPYAIDGELDFDREKFQRLSPIRHIENAVTPTLILQGEEDERCPICQAEEFFTKLMCNSKSTAEMVLYPGGSHHFFETGKPSHTVDVVNRLVCWITKWTVPNNQD